MATIQIPDEDEAELRQQAEAVGMSLQAYLHQELIPTARRRAKSQAIAAIREALQQDPNAGATTESILEARGS